MSKMHTFIAHCKSIEQFLSRPLRQGLIVVLNLVVSTFSVYMVVAASKNLIFLKMASAIFVLIIGVVLWAAFWAFVGYIAKRQARFFLQVAVVSFWSLLSSLLNIILGCVIYIFNMPSAHFFLINSVINIIFFIILINWNLAIATNLSLPKRLIGPSIPVLLIGILVILGNSFVVQERILIPQYNHSLQPPFIKILSSKSVDQFFDQNKKIFDIEIKAN